ncbi:MAG: Ig-like domain-containing protein, partial [Rubrobacter sp.]
DTTITSGPSDGSTVNSTSAEFRFTSNEPGATFECKMDNWGGDGFFPCSSPRSFDFLSEGTHTFTVRASDGANIDSTPAIRTWTVDPPPETTITSYDYPGSSGKVNGTVNSTSAEFRFTSNEAGATFECRLARQGETPGTFTACSSPKGYTGLTDGRYTFEVRARDGAGTVDASPASDTWRVDATPPSLTITSGPAEGSDVDSSSATFAFSASDASSGVGSVRCRLDDGSFGPCSGGASSHSVAGLADGQHTFKVRATDVVGNSTTASRTWTVDTSAPEAPPITSPTEGSRLNTGAFAVRGTAEANSRVELFEGVVSKGITTADGGGAWSVALSGVANGTHTYTAKATDAVGNTSGSSNSRTVIVDKVKPRVLSTNPLAGATDVLPGTNVVANFSEAMNANALRNPTTLRSTTFTLARKNPDGTTTRVAAKVGYAETTNPTTGAKVYKATLNPDVNLQLGKTYVATVTSGAKDLAGNALDQSPTLAGDQSKVWSFKIRS